MEILHTSIELTIMPMLLGVIGLLGTIFSFSSIISYLYNKKQKSALKAFL